MGRFSETARSRQQPKSAVTFSDFARQGWIKNYSARVPVTTIAKLEELQKRLSTHVSNWKSKQEFLFDLLEHAVDTVIREEPNADELRAALDKAAHRAMQRTASGQA